MAPKSHIKTDSPSNSTSYLPLRIQSRRGSNGSLPPASKLDKEMLNHALDQIHSVASQSTALTIFNDFAPPPSSSSGTELKGITSELQGGISGLYNRFRASVGGVRDIASSNVASEHRIDLADDASSTRSFSQKSGGLPSPTTNKLNFKSPKYDSSTASVSNLKSASAQQAATSQADGFDQSSKSETKPHRDSGSRQSAQISLSGVLAGDDMDMLASRQLDANDLSEGLERRQAISPRTAIPITLDDVIGNETSGNNKLESQLSSVLHDRALEKPTGQYASYGTISLADSSEAKHTARERPSLSNVNDDHSAFADKPLQASQAVAGGGPKTLLSNSVQQQQKVRLQTQIPGINFSRASSYETGGASSINTASDFKSGSEDNPAHEKQPAAISRTAPKSSATVQATADSRAVSGVLSQTRTRVLSKEYWMRDENARDCFYCGDAFSTFRRKHHCS